MSYADLRTMPTVPAMVQVIGIVEGGKVGIVAGGGHASDTECLEVRSVTKRSPTARPYADRIPRVPVGPLASTVLEECSEWLAAQGYSPGSAAGVVNLLGRLSLWMREVGAGVDDIERGSARPVRRGGALARLRVRHGEELRWARCDGS